MRSRLINRVSTRKGAGACETDDSLQGSVRSHHSKRSDDGSSVELGESSSSRGVAARRKTSRYGSPRYRQTLPLYIKRVNPQFLVMIAAVGLGFLVALRALSFVLQRTRLKPVSVSTPQSLVFENRPLIPSRRRKSVNTDLSRLDDDVDARETDFGGLDVKIFQEDGMSRVIYSDLRARRGASRDRLDSSSPSRDWYDYICKFFLAVRELGLQECSCGKARRKMCSHHPFSII